MDGWITIGTKLETKDLEKDIKNAKRELQKYEKEAEKLTKSKAKAELDLREYHEAKRVIEEMTNEALTLAQSEQEVSQQLRLEKIELENLNTKYAKQIKNLEDIESQIKENAINQDLMNKEVDELNSKLKQAKGISSLSDSIDKIGKSTANTIKSVGKWAVAIFGIRSAYNFVRQSASTLAQYNDQIASDLQYMSFAMASMLQPIIEKMIQLAYKLLSYVNYLSKAWFGVDLFANASAKAMEKGSKSAEKMKKSLAGFDEMNVLNDNGTTGAMGNVAPSMDLSAPENVEIPDWLKWIKENGSLVISILSGIGVALLAVNLGLTSGGNTLTLLLVITQIVDVFQGAISVVKNLIEWLKDPSWDNYVKTVKSGIESMGLLGDVILWIFDLFGGFEKVVEPLHTFYDWIKDDFVPGIGEFFSNLWNKIKEIFGPVVEFFSSTFKTVKTNIENQLHNIKEIFSFVWEKIKEIFGPVVNFFKEKFTLAFNKIKEVFSPVTNFISTLFGKIKTKLSDFGSKAGEAIGGAFKSVVNGILSTMEKILNTPIKAINKLIKIINDVPGINLKELSTFELPRLAVGGIINMPGKGVPIGGAIGGEVSKEGVIPLTDSQAMEELGATIGRYITINATITNNMNGRVISREIKRINANNEFATNR